MVLYPAELIRLLHGARGERRGESGAAYQRDEIAPSNFTSLACGERKIVAPSLIRFAPSSADFTPSPA
jgi:hypothetical protein